MPAATVNVKPNLQIVADDVKCSHGCTVSDLEEEQLFYFRSASCFCSAGTCALPVEKNRASSVATSQSRSMHGRLERNLKDREETWARCSLCCQEEVITASADSSLSACSRTRGVDDATARQVLVYSFGSEVTQHLKHPLLLKRIQEKINSTLAQAPNL